MSRSGYSSIFTDNLPTQATLQYQVNKYKASAYFMICIREYIAEMIRK